MLLKKLLLISLLVCSVNVYATNWVKVHAEYGITDYVDIDNIEQFRGYIYFYKLLDYGEPVSPGVWSSVNEFKADCKKFTYQWLTQMFYEKPMARGKLVRKYDRSDSEEFEVRPYHKTMYNAVKVACDNAK